MAGLVVTNPHLGTDAEGGWAMGFTWGFLGPAFSQDPPLVIAPDQLDAFNEGVLAGQQASIEGIRMDPSCFSLQQEVSSGAESLMTGVHFFEALGLVAATAHFAHFVCEVFVGTFLFMIPGPPSLDPDAEFDRIAGDMRDRLVGLGLDVGSLFIGAGIDEQNEGCELLFGPVFSRRERARDAVKALGRAKWVISQWDADAPVSGGGFAAVESSAG